MAVQEPYCPKGRVLKKSTERQQKLKALDGKKHPDGIKKYSNCKGIHAGAT
jgi:Mor family transcriptional regulator